MRSTRARRYSRRRSRESSLRLNACRHNINFALHPNAASQARTDKLVRFPDNRGKNFGPKAKAPGSVNSVKAGFQVDMEKRKQQ